MGDYIEIKGHDNVTVETSPKNINRTFYTRGNCICFKNGTAVAEFATHSRAVEVLKELLQAANDGEEFFTVPKE